LFTLLANLIDRCPVGRGCRVAGGRDRELARWVLGSDVTVRAAASEPVADSSSTLFVNKRLHDDLRRPISAVRRPSTCQWRHGAPRWDVIARGLI